MKRIEAKMDGLGIIGAKSSAIAVSLLIGGFALIVQRHTKSWTHPAVLFAAFWFCMTFVPLVGVIWVPIHPAGMLFILVCVVAFGLPAYIGSWEVPVAVACERRSQRQLISSPTLVSFIVIQTLTMLCLIVNLLLQDFSVSSFLANPALEVDRYLVSKYAGTLNPNPFAQAGIILNYVGVATGGLVVGSRFTWRNASILALAFSPALLNMVFYADKGTLFLSAAYFFGGVIVNRIRWGNLALITPSTLKVGAIAFAGLVPVLGFALYVRGSDAWQEAGDAARVWFYINSYAFSHVYAFSDWFAHYAVGAPTSQAYDDPTSLMVGFWTITPIARYFLPGFTMPVGNFSEYYVFPGTLQSNIYTMFRGLIYDFGFAGSLAFMFLFGLLSSRCYRLMLLGRARNAAEAFFIFLAGYIYSSFLISLTMWTSVFAAALGVYLILLVSCYETRVRAFLSRLPLLKGSSSP